MKKQLNLIETLTQYIEIEYGKLTDHSDEYILLACELAKILPDPTGNDRYKKIAARVLSMSNNMLSLEEEYEIDSTILRYSQMIYLDWPDPLPQYKKELSLDKIKLNLIVKLNKIISDKHSEIYTNLPAQDMIYRQKYQEAQLFLSGVKINDAEFPFLSKVKDPKKEANIIVKKQNESLKILSELDKERKTVMNYIKNAQTLDGLNAVVFKFKNMT